MKKEIVARLIQLNAEFYQNFAFQFSDTRQRVQPGVRRMMDSIESTAQILDLGCGNGELARQLVWRGFKGRYLGLDFSIKLLEIARNGFAHNPDYSFIQANLADPNWPSLITKQSSGFDIVLAFAVLHHIPGRENQLYFLQAVRSLFLARGSFIHSSWQFMNSERLQKRIHPWAEIGIKDSDVDSGDYLLDWRRGGYGLRYVHLFNEDELNALAAESGFRVAETFYSDGETGDLGLYQVWKSE